MFVAVNVGMTPVPFKPRPMVGLEFVQLYVAPVTVELKFEAVTGVVLHAVIFAIGLIIGIGFTITQTAIIGLEQPVAADVPTTLYKTV